MAVYEKTVTQLPSGLHLTSNADPLDAFSNGGTGSNCLAPNAG